MSVSYKSFSLSFALRVGEVSDEVPQRVDSGFSTCRFPLSNTLQRYEELVSRWPILTIIDRYWPILADIDRYWPLLLVKCNEFSCTFRYFFVTLHRNNNKEEKNDEKLPEEWVGSSSGSQLHSCSTFKRWLRQQSEMFCQWGVTPRTQLLPPVAVQWICNAYGIEEGELWGDCRVAYVTRVSCVSYVTFRILMWRLILYYI